LLYFELVDRVLVLNNCGDDFLMLALSKYPSGWPWYIYQNRWGGEVSVYDSGAGETYSRWNL